MCLSEPDLESMMKSVLSKRYKLIKEPGNWKDNLKNATSTGEKEETKDAQEGLNRKNEANRTSGTSQNVLEYSKKGSLDSNAIWNGISDVVNKIKNLTKDIDRAREGLKQATDSNDRKRSSSKVAVQENKSHEIQGS